MMKYVKTTAAPYFLMLTECGLVGRLEVESPEKHFIGGCRLCPYMKTQLAGENPRRVYSLRGPSKS